MAGRGRTTFQKRQKEQLRLERRQQKAARKSERKAQKDGTPGEPDDDLLLLDADGQPLEPGAVNRPQQLDPGPESQEAVPNAE